YEKYYPVKKKNTIYLMPNETVCIKNLRIVQNGLIAGEVKKLFEPSIQLALSAQICSYQNKLALSSADIDVIKYLKGETINIATDYKGWLLVTVDGFPLGWGKADGQGKLKNKYYAGWRMM
ncbi:MAG TPA: SAM-dependent methyltransferase, partial [Lachnospiraceae bacterium]|nr:SAM-dependent methyltransferase [Lachnospiraceae bacterium]